jgi:polyhydroxyalkanoate synthesis regulator phasin
MGVSNGKRSLCAAAGALFAPRHALDVDADADADAACWRVCSQGAELGKVKQAIQAVADLVAQNAEEDAATEAKLTARIEAMERRTASAQASGTAAQETSGVAQKAIQHVTTLVTENAEAHERTAGELNARIDSLERRVGKGGGGGGSSHGASGATPTGTASAVSVTGSPGGARSLGLEVARVLA